MAFWRRLLFLLPWRRRAAERDMQEELQSIAAMATPRELGNLTRAAEDARAAWGWPSVERLRVDVRHALLGFRSHRGTTMLAFVILTLTLAAGTITFSVVDAIVLQPLPYGDPNGLVAIARHVRLDDSPGLVSTQDYVAWRDRVRSFDGFAAVVPDGIRRLDSGGASQELRTTRVSSNLFDVLRLRPALGRFFRPDDETPGRSDVVVVAHAAWVRVFGADPSIVGRRVTFSNGSEQTTVEVVGVLPPGAVYPPAAIQPFEVFRPYVASDRDRMYPLPNRAFFVDVLGRLKPGVTLDQARADVEQATTAVRALFDMKKDPLSEGTVVISFHDRIVGKAKGWLLLVLAAVGCVVLVGCANAASLLLSRATARSRELSTRAALGASRGRLVRTLLAEGFFIAFAASAAATALSYWGVEIARASLPAGLARTSAVAIDARVLTVAIAAAIVCGLVAGSAPAWRLARADLFEELRVGGGVVGGRTQSRTLGAFLVAEVAFVGVLLVATTLLVASFVAVTTADLGFDRRNVVAIWVRPPFSNYSMRNAEQTAAAVTVFADVLNRARAVPGVAHAGLIGVGSAPLAGGRVRYSLDIPGFGETPRADWLETRSISPEYFSAMGLKVLRGRAFRVEDRSGAPAVAIINELAARRLFAGRDPVGIDVGFNGRSTRIVGVVQSLRIDGPEADPILELYLPFAQFVPPAAQVVVRTIGAPLAIAAAVRDAVVPIIGPKTDVLGGRPMETISEPHVLDDSFRELTAIRRFNAGLMSIFGVIALAIGAIGIYGTMAFLVAQQTKAIGLRIALGATQGHVLRSILRSSLWHVGLGAILGLAGARAVSSLFTPLVFGVEPTSPAVYAVVAGGLFAMAILAALVPARRAARIDPLITLRAE